ncbi:YciC family protein [Candidatus Pantoea edessiphila]|uniref:UPF0259 membrane protein CRV10_00775 n=1 Tax=Candidatus Pantoea edessiphila TaxID=2044610 RepID=A0A2P5SWS9_9GAMM|nr:YciC family protein [Candidatus Pantoea edessiphila]PPI86776.1 hypothetical protein CRV10_00775 [Candidatus Pantoea edessiphila]
MQITVNSLYRETKTFFRYQIMTFVLTALLAAFITTIFIYCIGEYDSSLNVINNNNMQDNYLSTITNEENLNRINKIITTVMILNLLELINNTILIGSVLYLISNLCKKNQINTSVAIQELISFIPRLMILIFIINLMIQIGFALLFFPGFIVITLCSMSPIILVRDKKSIFSSIKSSSKIVRDNLKIIIPAIIIWIMSKILCMMFFSIFSFLQSHLVSFIFMFINNLIFMFLITYLSRFHMLLNK